MIQSSFLMSHQGKYYLGSYHVNMYLKLVSITLPSFLRKSVILFLTCYISKISVKKTNYYKKR